MASNSQIFRTINFYIEERDISKSALSRKIGMTQAGFWRAIDQETLKVRDLMKVIEVLKIPPIELFEKSTPRVASEPATQVNESPGTYQTSSGVAQLLKEHNTIQNNILKALQTIADKD